MPDRLVCLCHGDVFVVGKPMSMRIPWVEEPITSEDEPRALCLTCGRLWHWKGDGWTLTRKFPFFGS